MSNNHAEAASQSILIVEDNETLAGGLRANLEVEGYRVDVAATGEEAIARLASVEPDMVMLDLALPGISGFEVLKQLRQAGSTVPVLVLSARDQEVDKVQGFRLGADDYVVKPVGALELIARVAALLRRSGRTLKAAARDGQPHLLRYADIEIDTEDHTVKRAGRIVDISPREFELLVRLYEGDGRLVPREVLMDQLWGYAAGVSSRTLDQHIARLRHKLERDPERSDHIITVRKIGYRLVR